MANIATLGFQIDTAPLQRSNAELRQLAANAASAERNVGRLGTTATSSGNRSAVAFRGFSNAVQGAAHAITAANNNAAVSAARTALAMTQMATATSAAAAAAQTLANAQARLGASSTRASASHMAAAGSASSLMAVYRQLVTLLAGREIIKASDEYTQLQNTMRLAGLEGEQLLAVEQKLFEAANKNGVAISNVSDFYRKAAQAQKTLGASTADMVRLTETVTAALRIQGTPAKQAEGALRQLTQAMTSANVRAEEFNSLQEGAFPVLQAAANGIERYGGNVMKMRADVIAGKLTNKEFFDGILKGSQGIIDKSESIRLTMGGAWTSVQNSFVSLVGQMDKATGSSDAVVNALKDVSKWMMEISKDPDFLNGVTTAFEIFKKEVEKTRKEIEGLLNVFSKSKGFFGTIRTELERSIGVLNTSALNKVEQLLEHQEGLLRKAEEEKGLAALYDPDKLDAATKKVDALTASVAKLKAQQDTIRQSATHQLPTMPPVVVTATKIDDRRTTPDANDAKSGKDKLADAYKRIQINAQQYIETVNREISALGMAEEKSSKMKHSMDLLHKVQDAGIPITQSITEWIEKQAAAMAKVDAQKGAATFVHDRLKAGEEFIRQQQIELDVIGMSAEAASAYRKEQDMLNEAKRRGVELTDVQVDSLRQSAKSQAEIEQRVVSYRNALETVKDLSKGFFEDLREGLNEGRTLWESFGSAAINVLNRIAAKIMDMAIDGIFDMVFSPGKPSSGAGTGNGSNAKTGGFLDGLGNIFRGGGGGGMGWWGSPIFKPTIDQEIAAWSSGGNVPWANQISWGQGIGALGGLASAGMNFARGGTGGTIGGIASLVGAGVSLIPGIGQIAGPIIGLLGGILPGLFGESKPEPPTARASGSLSFSGANFSVTGSETGGAESVTGVLGDLAKVIKDLAESAGALKGVTQQQMGIEYETFSKGEFSNGTVFVNRPDGSRMQWGQSSDPKMIEHALNTAAANVAHHMITTSKSTGDLMREGLVNFGLKNSNYAFKTEELQEAINDLNALQNAFKTFGKDLNPTEQALEGIKEQFDALKKIAEDYKISAGEVARIEAERVRQQQKLSTAFIKNIDREFMTPLERALQDIFDERADQHASNTALKGVQGHVDQSLRIEQLYVKKRNEILEEANREALEAQKSALQAIKDAAQKSVDDIQQLLNRLLPGGDLSNISGGSKLKALEGTYEDLRSRAFTTYKQEDIEDFLEAGEKFAEFAAEYGGGNKQITNRARDQLITDLELLRNTMRQVSESGQVPANGNVPPLGTGEMAKFMEAFNKMAQENTELRALLTRFLAKVGG